MLSTCSLTAALTCEELSSHALHLLLDGGPDVEGPHNGAHVLGLANGGQTRHSATNDQHLGWRHL